MVSLLLDCHELAARLATDDPPVVLDVRWTLGGPSGVDAFRRGHIPGAHFVDLDHELSAPPGPGRHPLPDTASFGAAMRRHGVDVSRLVVAYDAATGTSAARAWWLLRYFGHPNVALLDGGYAAWTGAGLPTEEGADRDPQPGHFDPTPGGMPLLDADGAASMARTGVLIDARAPERFRGENEPVDPVAGHIPGARNVPAQFDRESRRHVSLARCTARAVWRGRSNAGRTGRRVLRLRRGGHRGRLRTRARGDRRSLVRRVMERMDHRPEPADRSRRSILERRRTASVAREPKK